MIACIAEASPDQYRSRYLSDLVTEMRAGMRSLRSFLTLRRKGVILSFSLGAFLVACPCAGEDQAPRNQSSLSAAPWVRDWNRFPAIPERDTSAEVVGLGDIHGGYQRLVALLITGGLIKPAPQTAGYAWSGGKRTLVCIGDVINKGDHSIETIDLLMSLEAQAPASGGEVIVTLGNHEAEFLADPMNEKAHEFRAELLARAIDPMTLSKGQRPYGEWMMNRPFAARINDWFFSHAGNSSGKTIAELAQKFRQAVDQGRWDSPTLIGDDSLLEAREWWKGKGDEEALVDRYLLALRVKHIVFGHDPSAFGAKGEMGQEMDGRLFLIDVGMSPATDYSKGALLLIDQAGSEVSATSLEADGTKRELWGGKHAKEVAHHIPAARLGPLLRSEALGHR